MTSLLSTVLLARYYVNDQRSWHMEGLETALIVNTHLVLVTLVKLGARFPINQSLLCRRASTLLYSHPYAISRLQIFSDK